MKLKFLSVSQSQDRLNSLDLDNLPILSEDYNRVRVDLNEIYNNLELPNSNRTKYFKDIYFGVALKDYLESQEWFNLRVACDLGFWRYLSIEVIPNIVYDRWGGKSEDHFWKKPSRIWLRSIWWFAFLAWTNDKNTTSRLLDREVFDTDVILNTVERTGKRGTHVETYKTIIQMYGSLSKGVIDDFKGKKPEDTLFRGVMRLNTAKIIVMEPSLCEGGVKGYVRKLFEDLGINEPFDGAPETVISSGKNAVKKSLERIL